MFGPLLYIPAFRNSPVFFSIFSPPDIFPLFLNVHDLGSGCHIQNLINGAKPLSSRVFPEPFLHATSTTVFMHVVNSSKVEHHTTDYQKKIVLSP